MNYLKDVLLVNLEAFKKTVKKLHFVPLLALILIVIVYFQNFLINLLISRSDSVNFLLGFVRYLVNIVFMSLFLGILDDLILYNRFRFSSLTSGYKNFFMQVSQTMFVLVFFELICETILIKIDSQILLKIYKIFYWIIISLLYEEIYIGQRVGSDVYVNIFSFLKENILHWLVVLVAFIYINMRFEFYLLFGLLDLTLFIKAMLMALGFAFLYIYKGNLFYILNNSSVRKREFQRKL